MSIKRRYRLRRPQDFARLRAEGQVTRHAMMILSVAPNPLTHNRYGIITAKRLGNAVKRNRARRQVSHALRALHPALPAGFDVVCIVRGAAIGAEQSAIMAALRQTLRRADLLSEDEL